MITNVVVHCCVHFSYVQRISHYNQIKSYKENREWVKYYLLCLWYLIVHYAFKINLQEIKSWLDFNKSLQPVLYKLPHNIILTSASTLLHHYLTITLERTTKVQYVIQSTGLWCHVIEPAVPDISKDHCAFIIKALQSFKISGTTRPMTGCYNPQNLNIVSTAKRTTYHKYHIILLSKQTYTDSYLLSLPLFYCMLLSWSVLVKSSSTDTDKYGSLEEYTL